MTAMVYDAPSDMIYATGHFIDSSYSYKNIHLHQLSSDGSIVIAELIDTADQIKYLADYAYRTLYYDSNVLFACGAALSLSTYTNNAGGYYIQNLGNGTRAGFHRNFGTGMYVDCLGIKYDNTIGMLYIFFDVADYY